MFTETLLPDTLRALKEIKPEILPPKTYLAGGSSLALQIGHRISVDLDFFTSESFDETVLSNELRKIARFSLEQKGNLSVLGKIGETRFSIFSYPYNLIAPAVTFDKIHLADKKDLAAMKIHALEDRGTKRDFIDVFFLAKSFTLEQMMGFYDQKYHCLDDHLYNIIRSLNYFSDAEGEEIPTMLQPIVWKKIKEFFQGEALRLSKTRLKL